MENNMENTMENNINTNEINETNEETQSEKEIFDFAKTLTDRELEQLNDYAKQNYEKENRTTPLAELKFAINKIREANLEARPITEKFKDATNFKEQTKIMEEAGLFDNPRKHYFEGKPLPVNNVKTLREKTNEILASSEIHEGFYHQNKKDISRSEPKKDFRPSIHERVKEKTGLGGWKVTSDKI